MSRWLMSIGFGLVAFAAVWVSAAAHAAEPLLEPVLTSDVQMRADRATVIEQDQGKLVLLEGDVSLAIGSYGFKDQRALVRITRREGLGPVVRDFAIVFDHPESTGDGGVQADGKGLLVTVASSGKVLVSAELSPSAVLVEDPFTRSALARINEYDRRVTQPRQPVPAGPILTEAQAQLRAQRQAAIEAERRRIQIPEPGDEPIRDADLVRRPVLPAQGTVRYGSVDRIVYQRGEDEDAVILIGGVRVMYQDRAQGRDVLLTAERIVIFVDKDDSATAGAMAQVEAGNVRGVYLEDGAVISDGTTTVRAPRAFYDLQTDRAILLDAVVYSYDVRQRVPLYMRADVIRQTSADTFSADDATFTTSEFGKPHLSIGASRITLQQVRQADGRTESWVTAEDLTLRSGETPFFYWPAATVQANRVPLRRIQVGGDGGNGPGLLTRWDLFALADQRAPQGVDLVGDVDVRGEHGLGLGSEINYEQGDFRGDARGYVLPFTSGTDEIASRDDVDFDNEQRGFFRARHRQRLPAGWEMSLEASYVSDPTLLEELFIQEAYTAEPYETSAYFKRIGEDDALSALVSGQTNNFLPQLPQLMTPGYAVNKLPELEYRIITSVFDDRATLFHESRVSRMRAFFGDDSPADRGFTNAQSNSAFGFANNTSFDDAAIANNFPRDIVNRFDSRTELAAPTLAGPIDLTPFAVARVTAYDGDFSSFNGGNDDQLRLWGGLGLRSSTQLSKTDSDFSSQLLDVQGLRHIVVPGVTLAYYDNSLDTSNLPIYDPEVERLTEGTVARVGVTNTWQTQRGGLGRSRTVDWLRLKTEAVLVSEDATNPNAIGRYYDARPEYTLGDDHFYTELMWAATEATAVTGEVNHDFDDGHVVQWRLGIENRHDDRLTTQINYREIDILDAQLLSYGASLQLTTKYRVGLFHVIDLGQQTGSRAINLALERRIPRATLGLVIGYDDIDGEARLSFVLSPQGSSDLGLIEGINNEAILGAR